MFKTYFINIIVYGNRFVEPISDVYVHHGQEANFRAIITGQPSPKVTWYCNYKKIAVCFSFYLIFSTFDF